MMDLNQMTERLQNAFLDAQSLAIKSNHQQVDEPHLFLSLMNQEDSLINTILNRMEIPLQKMEDDFKLELAKIPQVSGTGADQGSLYISMRLQRMMVKAEELEKSFADEYLSVEHVLLAAAQTKDSVLGKALSTFKKSEAQIFQVIKEIRGNQKVTSQNPEATYDVLK
ncbi:MAG: Clp protease N-terminal domain-containing protein, partial [Bacillota bacterium]|nr:Clp protease N-terminal domain-containing protein [Bacillota bacterium]